MIGQVTWYWESEQTDWRRLGLAIYDERHWGGGLGTDAQRLWTDYLFARTDTLRLDFATFSGNPGMIAVGQRLGLAEEGRFRRARRWSGGVHDAVVYGSSARNGSASTLRNDDRFGLTGQGPITCSRGFRALTRRSRPLPWVFQGHSITAAGFSTVTDEGVLVGLGGLELAWTPP